MAESTKTYSTKQEKMVAEVLGGYAVGGSGAMPTAPGDVKTYDWLVECKTHTSPDHPIFFDCDVWNKINNEAMGMQRKPVLIVDDGSQKENRTWCLCYSADIDLNATILVDYPAAIRKNISCKHSKLKDGLKAAKKAYTSGTDSFYQHCIYEVKWMDQDVCIMPLSDFKEIFDK